jgi:dTDP-4-dehydrorhamnose reductase
MRWFVIGCRGQLGSALLEGLGADPRHQVSGADLPELDVCDLGAVERALEAAPPEVLVNAAAYTDVDGCERDGALASRVNAEAPGALAILCSRRGSRLVHVSTDYVFGGEAREPYREDTEPRPLSHYGRSKLQGERAVLEAAPEALVARTAWLFGRGRNFVAAVCGRARSLAREGAGAGLRVVDDQSGSPTYARDLAEALVALVEGGATGLYHVANRGVATRWELARAALDHAGLADVPIERVRTADYPTAARRPFYTALDCSRAAAAGVRLRPWREALVAYLDSPESPLAGDPTEH